MHDQRQPQTIENAPQTSGRKRPRVESLPPGVRSAVVKEAPILFEMGGPVPSSERVAERLGVSRLDVVDILIDRLMRKGPSSEGDSARVIQMPLRRASRMILAALAFLLLPAFASAQVESPDIAMLEAWGEWFPCDLGFALPGCGTPAVVATEGQWVAAVFQNIHPETVAYEYSGTFMDDEGLQYSFRGVFLRTPGDVSLSAPFYLGKHVSLTAFNVFELSRSHGGPNSRETVTR